MDKDKNKDKKDEVSKKVLVTIPNEQYAVIEKQATEEMRSVSNMITYYLLKGQSINQQPMEA